jgi:hypothetical protein
VVAGDIKDTIDSVLYVRSCVVRWRAIFLLLQSLWNTERETDNNAVRSNYRIENLLLRLSGPGNTCAQSTAKMWKNDLSSVYTYTVHKNKAKPTFISDVSRRFRFPPFSAMRHAFIILIFLRFSAGNIILISVFRFKPIQRFTEIFVEQWSCKKHVEEATSSND